MSYGNRRVFACTMYLESTVYAAVCVLYQRQMSTSWKLKGTHGLQYTGRYFGTTVFPLQFVHTGYVCDPCHSQNKTDNVPIMQPWGAFAKPFVPWESNEYYIFCVCVCSLSCPACKARATFYIICGVSGCTIFFFHISSNGVISLEKRFLNINYMFESPLKLLPDTFLISRVIQRDIIINVRASSWKVSSYSCQILTKLVFSRHVFEKSSDMKLHQTPPSGSRVIPCGQTDGHDKANSRFSQFCERA